MSPNNTLFFLFTAEDFAGPAGQQSSAPVIRASFTDVDVYEGTPVEFICHVDGSPGNVSNLNCLSDWYIRCSTLNE